MKTKQIISNADAWTSPASLKKCLYREVDKVRNFKAQKIEIRELPCVPGIVAFINSGIEQKICVSLLWLCSNHFS